MIEIEIDSAILKSFCDAVTIVTGNNSQPVFMFQPDGLSIVALDGAKIMLANIGIRRPVFVEYDVKKVHKVSFDSKELGKHLTDPVGTIMLTIKTMEYGDNDNRIDVMVPSKYGFKSVEIPILGEIEPSMVPKKMPYDSVCKLDLGALEGVVKDANRVDTVYCRFNIGDENELVAKLNGASSKVINVLEDTKAIIAKKFNPEANWILSKDYLDDAVKIGKCFTNIAKLSFATELIPILFDYQLNFDAYFRLYVAPVIAGEGETK